MSRPRAAAAVFSILALSAAAAPAQGVLRLPLAAPAETFDPHARLDFLHYRVFAQLYEAPLEVAFDEKGQMVVAPALCELPTLSPDLKTMRLRVRKGSLFHDDPCFEGGKGREATAADVAASLLRHADPDAKSPAYPLFVEGRFVGVDAWRDAAAKQRGADYAAPPRGIRTEGDEVVLEMTEPYPALRALLTQPWASVVPFEAVRRYGAGFGGRAVGTGPFRLGDQDASRLRLLKHEGYRVRGKPALAEVRFEFVASAEDRLARLASGDLDALDVYPDVESKLVDAKQNLLKEHAAKGRRILDGTPLSVSYLAFNCETPLFKHAATRRAVGRALDRAALAKALFGERALRIDGPLPPIFPEGTTFNAAGWPDGGRDLKAVPALLKEAGYADAKDVPEFPLDVPNDFPDARSKAAAALLAAQLKEAGFRVVVREEPMAKFYERSARGDFAVVWLSWFADYPDAENFLLLFRSDKLSGGKWEHNHGRFAHPDADRLYLDVASKLPGKERLWATTELLRLLRRESPWVPIGLIRRMTVVQKGVDGLAENLLNWSMRDATKR